ncbi:hypothetical protein L202_02980 [Cryptococcus amylolentus CBS 6039]|uniref:Uncharacterized protein n=2 Tax=Cryptococcus amylolentus TaxID=104669 RepID=A0A1E3HX08_9TREE|nr:hypothetical protein L202_02980 [Cryptococcus amylolentus CBS 6039]ODN80837.1 hypothetical protein L202_02980 [Cryptococcus amylolentus CBS 6039]ODO09353.1 hypothetical protein I350_02953 [Cryptococcus amylolentus CBS 6273]
MHQASPPISSSASPHDFIVKDGADEMWLEFAGDDTTSTESVEGKKIGVRQKVLLRHQALVSFLRSTRAKLIVANTPATNEGMPALTYTVSSTSSIDSSIMVQTPASDGERAEDRLWLELKQGLEMWQAGGSRHRYERGLEVLPPLIETSSLPESGINTPAAKASTAEENDGSLFSSLKRAGGRRLGGGHVKACWEEYIAGKAKSCVKAASGREKPRFF